MAQLLKPTQQYYLLLNNRDLEVFKYNHKTVQPFRAIADIYN